MLAQKSVSTAASLNPFKNSWFNPTIFLLPLLTFGYFQWQLGSISELSELLSPFTKPGGNNSSLFKELKDDVLNFEAMRQQYAAQCPEKAFKPHIFSTDPLIIYIEDYLSQDETKYLLNLALVILL
jgi:hypothetical protein